MERITFHSPATGFTVAKLQEPHKGTLTCLVGTMPHLQPGESIRCTGSWKNDKNHGWQFAVEGVTIQAPADVHGIEKYLGSGLIKGIGPHLAKAIVGKFGILTLDIIDQDPEELRKVPGIGKGRIGKITTCWAQQRTIREVMVFLQSYEVSPAFAQRIFKTYGQESIAKVRENPYALARDVHGIGFKTADQIAQKMGIEPNSPQRISAGIEFVLHSLSEEGHVCYPHGELVEQATAMLGVSPEPIVEQIGLLAGEKRLVIEEERVWLKALYLTETGIARELKRLIKAPSHLRKVDTEKALAWVQEKLRLTLATQQKEAVVRALTDKVQILTGGPGTGKSTITKAILAITRKLTSRILLAAPTGRAAKRMAEITGREAKTLHSLLEFDFQIMGFRKGKSDPLSCDLIIVDEASMIDTSLMYSLLKALPDEARLIVVGDIDQLPSVGPGNVLRDLISTGKIPTTTLNQIFRQAQGSKIITSAHKINAGIVPDLSGGPESDFFFIEQEEPEQILHTLIGLVSQRLPKTYGFDPIRDIQVLAPMKRGAIGIEALNTALQGHLNPSSRPLFYAGKQLHVGDKVMQIRNNYDKEVYNGDVGLITKIDEAEQQLTVSVDGRPIPYDFLDLDELVLAYACSIHKYQGSECPCVVIPVHTSHFKLLTRNLIYTGVTRGRKLVVLIGTKKALAMAVHNHEVQKRHTGLPSFL